MHMSNQMVGSLTAYKSNTQYGKRDSKSLAVVGPKSNQPRVLYPMQCKTKNDSRVRQNMKQTKKSTNDESGMSSRVLIQSIQRYAVRKTKTMITKFDCATSSPPQHAPGSLVVRMEWLSGALLNYYSSRRKREYWPMHRSGPHGLESPFEGFEKYSMVIDCRVRETVLPSRRAASQHKSLDSTTPSARSWL